MQLDPFFLLGMIGMVLILIAFLLLQRHCISQDDLSYDALNFFGSALLVIYGIVGHAWPFVILNGIFGLYSLIDMFSDMKSHKKTLLGHWRKRK